jgi:type IV pilus assembly protein PilQ
LAEEIKTNKINKTDPTVTISLEFRKAEIVDVIRTLADFGEMNIVIDEDVKGLITISIKNVPLEQAFESILQAANLVKVKTDGIIIVLPLEKYRKMRIIREKTEIETEELLTKVFKISFADPKEVAGKVKKSISERGSVDVDVSSRLVVVRDIEEGIKQAEEVVKGVDRKPQQILIEARIVEISTSFLRNLGIRWGGEIKSGEVEITGGVNVTVPSPIASASFIFGTVDDIAMLDVRLSALERSGHAKIVSSPRITTLEGREALISQGFKIPYETVSEYGTQTQFIDAALELKVRPYVTPEGILLDMKVAKNFPDISLRSARGVPSISKNEAYTQVVVSEGKTASIGGIYVKEKAENIVAVPLLSKIPVIGYFFRRKEMREDERELILFIAPSVLK